MDKRRKMLLVGLLAAVGVYLAYLAADRTVVAGWRKLADREKSIDKRRCDAEKSRQDLLRAKTRLVDFGRRGFGLTEESAAAALRDWVRKLEKQAGVKLVDRPPLAVPIPTGGGDCKEIPARIHAEGELDAVVRFLHLLSSCPRLGYVRDWTIEAIEPPAAPPPAQAARIKKRYKLDAEYVAVWLNPLVPYGIAADAGLAPRHRLLDNWSKYQHLSHDMMNMFQRYREPRAEVIVIERPVSPQSPARSSPPYSDLSVAGIYQAHGPECDLLYVKIRNGRSCLEKKVGEPLADGVLERLDPTGRFIVLNVKGRSYVIEAGCSLADRVPLDDYQPIEPLMRPAPAGQP